MATRSKQQSDPDEAVKYSDRTGEETEPEPFLREDEDVDTGVPGQIMYPEVVVDAERAGEYAAGKVDTLDPDDESERRTDRERIQDDIDNYSRDDEETLDDDGDDTKSSTRSSTKSDDKSASSSTSSSADKSTAKK